MKKAVVLKYGEIVLKGLNRGHFESLLMKRVRRVLKPLDGEYEIKNSQSTIIVRGNDGDDMEAVAERLTKVFGVTSVCVGIECEKDMKAIENTVRENAVELIGNAKTFKCNAKRGDKSFPYISPQICDICGGAILSAVRCKVDVENPEAVVTIEVRDEYAFVHGAGRKGAGGMPSGSNGRALLLLSGGIDSPVAGYMIAKRGVETGAVYFESPPYTSEAAREKVISLAKVLAGYSGSIYLNIVSVTALQQILADKCEERLFTVLLRRFMMRIAEKLAERLHYSALITGESIGQVASQTMDALVCTDNVVNMPVFRPCIGLDKEEIVVISRNIGAFDISIQPYEDCCTVFTPRHPKLTPTVEELEAEERRIDVEALVEEALATVTAIKITE